MTQKTSFDGVRWTCRVDFTNPHSLREVLRFPDNEESTIVLAPAAGSTITVEFSASCTADLDAGTALWAPAEGLGAAGVVSALMLDTLGSTLTAVRLTASAIGSRVEVAQ